MIEPFKGNFIITQRFGENLNDFYKNAGLKGHEGIDIAMPNGTPLLAPFDGIVLTTSTDIRRGEGVIIMSDTNYDYQGQPCRLSCILWHMQDGSITVKAGDKVKQGQQVGLSNNTGQSTGPHLHLGISPLSADGQRRMLVPYTNGYAGCVDPMPYLYPAQCTITRTTGEKETLGTLTATNGLNSFMCKTLERPWLNNAPNISAIPTGTYNVEWTFSFKFLRYMYEVKNVPNRAGIRIHSGNYVTDVQGCISLGNGYTDLNKDGLPDIINSRITIKAFEDFMGKKPFKLTIK